MTAAWAQSSPREAAAFAASLGVVESRTQAVVSAVSGWAQHAPQEAAEWALFSPDMGLRALAFEHIMTAWGKSDPAAAAEWLARMPENRARHAALATFSRAIVDRYPGIAMTMAQEIGDDSQCLDHVQSLRHWAGATEEATARTAEGQRVTEAALQPPCCRECHDENQRPAHCHGNRLPRESRFVRTVIPPPRRRGDCAGGRRPDRAGHRAGRQRRPCGVGGQPGQSVLLVCWS